MTPNEQLRAHVTRVGFNLQLTKNQIAELIWLDHELSDPRSVSERIGDNSSPSINNHVGRHLLTNSIASRHALMARGLVTYAPPPRKRRRDAEWLGESMRDRYSITSAGRAVVDLLKMAGLWDEVTAEIPWTVKPAPWTSFTADEEIKHLQARLAEAAQKVEDERDKTRAAETHQAEAEQARWRAEAALGRLKEQVRDVAALVGGDAA